MLNRIFSDDSAKAAKAADFGYLNAIQYMAPADLSGWNLCPKATEGCKAACLGWFSGQAGMVKTETEINATRQSRLDKAKRFMTERAAYMRDVVRSIELMQRKAKRLKVKLCVRMNGSTDIAWEGIRCTRAGVEYANVFAAFPDVTFVDYTKIARRFWRALPANYSLTLSRSENNDTECRDVLARGGNVAVIFAKDKPATFLGVNVIDGDQHDLRHLDPRGVVVGLTPKGRKAKRDQSGFVVRQ